MLNNFYRALRRVAFLFVVTAAASLAQGQIEQGPRPVPGGNSNGGGGLGIGINIDIGTIFNAIKNLKKNDEQPKDKPPVLQKKAVTVSSGSSGNYTIDWVVQYANNTGVTLPSATVIDGPIATIIPGSLQQPPGWTGTTNANPPVDNFAKWTGANVAPHGLMTATFAAASTGALNITGAGDGFQPIPYKHSGGRRIYLMNHHLAPGSALFDCIEATTGAHCLGGWPRPLPFGDNTAKTSGSTGNNAEYVIDGSKFYYPAQNLSEWGIGCFDLELASQCGFTQLGASNTKQTQLQGPWRVGNELYFASYDGQVYCAQLTAGLPACISGDYKIPLSTLQLHVPGTTGKPASMVLDWYNGTISAKVIGSRIYFSTLTQWYQENIGSMPKAINCFKADTKTACWSTNVPTKGNGSSTHLNPYGVNITNFVHYNTSGIAQGICTKYGGLGVQKCTDMVSGAPITLPAIFPADDVRLSSDVHVWPYSYFTETRGPNGAPGRAWCWNWATNKYCLGNNASFSETPGTPYDYGNNVDDRGCIWTNGHNNRLWNFDPGNIDPVTKKALPCGGDGGKSVSVFQPLQYCSGPKPFHWLNVEVKGALITNYSKFIVKVLDSTTNAVLLTKDLMPSGLMKVDITSLDAQTLSKPLKIEIEYTPKPGVTDKPYLEVRYDAPPAEFCFKSKHTCQQKNISNVVETPDPSNPQQTISVKVDVPAPQNCKIIDPPPPVCGQPGQPPCQTCGTPTTPACPACGLAGQPPCPVCGTANTPACNSCGLAGQPPCVCIPGTPGCFPPPPPVCSPGSAGWPACLTCANPPCVGGPKVVVDVMCMNPPCAEKPKQSVSEEFKETKTGCVRKVKPAAEASAAPKPKSVAKPKPKPVAGDATVASNSAAQATGAMPKPKPRPVVKAKPKATDDCE